MVRSTAPSTFTTSTSEAGVALAEAANTGTSADVTISSAPTRRTGASGAEPRANARLHRVSVHPALRAAHHEAHDLAHVRRGGGARRGDRFVHEGVHLL